MLWKLLAADIEGVESIGTVGTVFEKVFFGLRLLLHRLVLTEAVATTLHSCGLNGEDKVIVVLADEVRHEALLPAKMNTCHFAANKKPIRPQTLHGTMEQATKITA